MTGISSVTLSTLLLGSRLLVGMLLSNLASASADQDLLHYLYTPSLPVAQQPLQDSINHHVRNKELTQALTLSQSLLDTSTRVQQDLPVAYGMLLVNHGLLQIAVQDLVSADDYDRGLLFIERGIKLMQDNTKPFSANLRNALIVRGITQIELSNYAAAEDSLRHAQHITHRHRGVYSPQQIPVINYITRTQLRRRQTLDADREQRFNLLILEQEYGTESPTLISRLNSLGNYFAHRGKSISRTSSTRLERESLFNTSIAMYERAVTIIEQHFGANDLRLVQPLHGISKTRIWQGINKKQARSALERSLVIVLANPNSSLSDKATAMVDLGDLYTMTTHNKAAQLYLDAWHLLQESPATKLLAEQLFGTPIRLPLESERKLYLSRIPDAAAEDEPIYASLEYAVTEKGHVNHLRVIDHNLPNEQVRLLKMHLRVSKFRPRIIAGQLVSTEGLRLRQLYYVIDKPSATPAKTEDDSP